MPSHITAPKEEEEEDEEENTEAQDEHLIVGTWSGKPVSESAVREALAAAVKAAGLKGEERLSAHSLRHSYTSRLGSAV